MTRATDIQRDGASAGTRAAPSSPRRERRTSRRPASVRTSRQKPVIPDRWSKFPQREGKTHALFLGNRSRISRAADESQTVRGPLHSTRFPAVWARTLSLPLRAALWSQCRSPEQWIRVSCNRLSGQPIPHPRSATASDLPSLGRVDYDRGQGGVCRAGKLPDNDRAANEIDKTQCR